MRNGQNNIVYISDYTAGQYRRFANIYPDKVVFPETNYCNVAIAAERYHFGEGRVPRHFVPRNDIFTLKTLQDYVPCHFAFYNQQRALDHEGRAVGVAALWGGIPQVTTKDSGTILPLQIPTAEVSTIEVGKPITKG